MTVYIHNMLGQFLLCTHNLYSEFEPSIDVSYGLKDFPDCGMESHTAGD